MRYLNTILAPSKHLAQSLHVEISLVTINMYFLVASDRWESIKYILFQAIVEIEITCQNRYFHQKTRVKLYFLIDTIGSAPANERFEVLLSASSRLAFVIFKVVRNLKKKSTCRNVVVWFWI